MKKIALFGGSFDPPHYGHLTTIDNALRSGLVKEVWLVPTGLHRDKQHHSHAEHRKAMLTILMATMFEPRAPVFLDTTQLDQPWKISSSQELLEEKRKTFPKNQFHLLIGSDLIEDIPKWKKSEKLMKQPGLFLAVDRLGFPKSGKLPRYVQKIEESDFALSNLSSTQVRERILNEGNVEDAVPPAVLNYIQRYKLYSKRNRKEPEPKSKILWEGPFLRLRRNRHWEYVERPNATGVVLIVGMTAKREVILTEQYRIPLQKRVIEFPAGLVNDQKDVPEESLEQAARREFLEETGYRAQTMRFLTEGPISSGLTSETVSFFLAENLKRVNDGGGDESEAIEVHRIPLDKLQNWLERKKKQGRLIDPKIYAGLYFLNGNF